MNLTNQIISLLFSKRIQALDAMRDHGVEMQQQEFTKLISLSGGVEYLKAHNIKENSSYEQFSRNLPIVTYEDIADKLIKTIDGEPILSSEKVRWIAKSSGTTNDSSKYIPINETYLNNCHFQGGRDTIAAMITNYPDNKAYTGKSLTLGGSQSLFGQSDVMVGDLSAILISNAPKIVSVIREPSKDIALLSDFEEKVEAICKTCSEKNITSFAGVPSWNLVLMKRVLEYTGKKNLLDVWENMSLFMHGGISFEPYRKQYEALIPRSDMVYLETYNASEGFFALQDTKDSKDGMLLLLDYGIFYEFIPVDKMHQSSYAVPLSGVKLGVTYAMIISNNSGFWRYLIGDTVEFTSISPYRVKIVGRTKQFINAFGEELMASNTDTAIIKACQASMVSVNEYTVAPIFMNCDDNGSGKGAHEWVVEFETEPADIGAFARLLDEALQELNSDYKAKRFGDATMKQLTLHSVAKGTFYKWMTSRGRQGGQNKVPRLSSDRRYVEHLLNDF